MATSFSKLLDVSSLTNKIQLKVEKAVDLASKDLLKLLRTKVSLGSGSYVNGEGISPYDYINKSKDDKDRAIKKWSYTTMKVGHQILTEFNNSSSYAEFLYGKTRSVGHANGFRSADEHEKKPYKYINGKKTYFEKRPNQLSFAKWMGFRRYMKKKLETEIKKEFKL